MASTKFSSFKGLTFNDVGMIPKYNTIMSRMDTTITTQLHNDIYSFPFVPANMDTVISREMAKILNELGGLIIYHRFCSLEEKKEIITEFPLSYMSVGISEEEKKVINELIDYGCRRYCIDIAHGHSEQVAEVIKLIRDLIELKDGNLEKCSIIAGNICTYEGYRFLIENGANICKVGVGPGCLSGLTKIQLADGTSKPICEIEVGDWVKNKDEKAVKVINVMNMGPKRILKIVSEDEKIELTYSHLINCYNEETKEEKWIEAGELIKNRDFIPKGNYYKKYEIIETNEIVETWDLEVDCETHSFIANNMIVHNSACTTRMKTGFGVPQFTALKECVRAKRDLEEEGKKSWLIADGGIQHPKDSCLAVAVGSDMIMMGNIFAKTIESAGKKFIKADNIYVEINKEDIIEYVMTGHNIYSHYRGQASLNFMKSYYGEKKRRTAEGVDFYTKCSGTVEEVLDEYNGSLRSSLTYAGASNISEFVENVEFIETTANYINESNHRGNLE